MKPFEIVDELYFSQQGDLPVEPLAVAHSKRTGKNEPMALAYDFDKGRIFQTVLGHDEAAILLPGSAELIRRGCAWAASK